MRLIMLGLAVLMAAVVPAVAQKGKQRDPRSDIEFRTVAPAEAERFEIQIPDVASGRSQRRVVSDMMLRLSLPGGDVDGALRLPNGAAVDRDLGLFRAHLYVISGGRLLPDAEARCDRWVDDVAVCKLSCEGGAFGLKRRGGKGPIVVSFVGGRLLRGSAEEDKPNFSLNACAELGAAETLLAPAGGRPMAEVPMRTR
jgi:hypothetical protein